MTVTDGDLQFVDTGEQCGKARRVCQKDAVPHILAKLLRASHFANGDFCLSPQKSSIQLLGVANDVAMVMLCD
jgi:hypothetical protein